MRRETLALLMMMLVLAETALAEPAGAAKDAPRFTLAEEIIIARNDALSALLPVDPWSVRKIMDAVTAAKLKSAPVPDRNRDLSEPVRKGTVQIDPSRNPDLSIFQRASPEAAYDLFQLLKRVGDAGAK